MKLCKLKYFNWSLFHSIQKNFIAQTGKPASKEDLGTSVYLFDPNLKTKYFPIESKPKILHKSAGLLSMVNNGSDYHGSQFFITLSPNLNNLDKKCTVFGKVVEGFEILEDFNNVITNENNRPLKDIR